jgi:two-component system, NarL family, sensor histidine kinase UhpB
MKKKKVEPRNAQELRRQAEELLNSWRLDAEKLAPVEMVTLLHELQVHQIELEMQNEELRRAQVALETSQASYADLYDFAPVGYLTLDEAGLILQANLTAAQQLGIPRHRLLGCPFPLLAASKERQKLRRHIREVFQSQERQSTEISLTPQKGEEFFALVDSIFIQDATGNGLCRTSFTDITARRQAEEALRQSGRQLRFLSSQLLIIQEKERGRISRELHDELGQSLIILKFQIQSLLSNLPKTQKVLRSNGQAMLHYLDETIENVRRLSHDLSPLLLEELGLSAAIQHLLENIVTHAGIKVSSVRIDEIGQLFSTEEQITIYRILQECLTNIIKHAQATQVSVEIIKWPDYVSFKVVDDGKGFDERQTRKRKAKDKGIGLTAMKERVSLMRGALEIRSQKGQGTCITVTIPSELKESELWYLAE